MRCGAGPLNFALWGLEELALSPNVLEALLCTWTCCRLKIRLSDWMEMVAKSDSHQEGAGERGRNG